jgi:DNA-directed RNA polymerase specialized sigma24 family protein
VSQLAAETEKVDRPVIDRAQRYESAALEALFSRCVRPLYRLCKALVAEPSTAEALTRQALMRGLDSLPGFAGDDEDFLAGAMHAAAAAAYPRRSRDAGLRQSLAQLSASEYELVALRVLGGQSTDQLARTLNSRQAALRGRLLSALRALAADGVQGVGFFGPGLEDFDIAVDSVVGGESPERAAALVSQPTDVLARLHTVALLTRISTGDPGPNTEVNLRQEFLSTAAERRVRWVQRHQAAPKVPGMEHKRYPGHGRGYALLVGGLIVAVLLGLTLAIGTSIADPDSPLYPVKAFGEKVLVDVNPDAVGRANTEISLAGTRQREAEDMAAAGRADLAVQAVRDRNSLLESAAKDLQAASSQSAHWKSSRDDLVKTASMPLSGLEAELAATGHAAAADEVRRLDIDWGHRLDAMRQGLGAPLPAPSPSTLPGP